jgi:competence protein ComEA
MFKKFVAALAALLAATAFAAVDANKATQTELEAISGIGPAISANIISERKKGDFKDWNDLVARIKGVGDKNAAKFSEGGLTVNGKAYPGAPAEPAKATTTAKAPATAKAATAATPATAAAPATEPAKTTTAKTAAADKSGVDKAASAVKGSPKTVATNVKEEAHAAKESVTDAKAKSAEKKAAKAETKAEAKAEKAAAASAPKK